jgi:hypothetical protein
MFALIHRPERYVEPSTTTGRAVETVAQDEEDAATLISV